MIATAVPLFSKVENRGLDPRPAIKTPAWGPEHKGVRVPACSPLSRPRFSILDSRFRTIVDLAVHVPADHLRAHPLNRS